MHGCSWLSWLDIELPIISGWVLWTDASNRFLALPPITLYLLASWVPCIAQSHIEMWCTLRRCIQIRETIRSITNKAHYIFLKTATIPTYHGISIAIPRYTVVQRPSLFIWLPHCHICFAWSESRMTVGFALYIFFSAWSSHILLHWQRHTVLSCFIHLQFWLYSKCVDIIFI